MNTSTNPAQGVGNGVNAAAAKLLEPQTDETINTEELEQESAELETERCPPVNGFLNKPVVKPRIVAGEVRTALDEVHVPVAVQAHHLWSTLDRFG